MATEFQWNHNGIIVMLNRKKMYWGEACLLLFHAFFFQSFVYCLAKCFLYHLVNDDVNDEKIYYGRGRKLLIIGISCCR